MNPFRQKCKETCVPERCLKQARIGARKKKKSLNFFRFLKNRLDTLNENRKKRLAQYNDRLNKPGEEQRCDLECIPSKSRPKIKKRVAKQEPLVFVGPVRIVFVAGPICSSYYFKIFQTALLVLCQMMCWATIMPIAYYCLRYLHHYSINAHIFFYTLAFQGIIAQSYMINHAYNNLTIYLQMIHRQRQINALKSFAYILMIYPTIVFMLWSRKLVLNFGTPHSVTGLIAVLLSVVEFLIDFICKLMDPEKALTKWLKFSNLLVGILAFTMSYICFGCGLLDKPSLYSWFPNYAIVRIIFYFCTWYSVIIILSTFLEIILQFQYVIDDTL